MTSRQIFGAPLHTACCAAALTLAGCGEDGRTAEAETPVSEAEVATELPENIFSDQQLQQTADVAAEMAASPSADAVREPVVAENGAANVSRDRQTPEGPP